MAEWQSLVYVNRPESNKYDECYQTVITRKWELFKMGVWQYELINDILSQLQNVLICKNPLLKVGYPLKLTLMTSSNSSKNPTIVGSLPTTTWTWIDFSAAFIGPTPKKVWLKFCIVILMNIIDGYVHPPTIDTASYSSRKTACQKKLPKHFANNVWRNLALKINCFVNKSPKLQIEFTDCKPFISLLPIRCIASTPDRLIDWPKTKSPIS